MDFYPFTFSGPIKEHWFDDKFCYHVLWLADDLAEQLPVKDNPRLRITGELNGKPIEAALNPVRGRWYVLISKKLQKTLGVSLGAKLRLDFAIADQDAVDVPPALRAALEEHPDLNKNWNKLTPGKKRGLAYRVATAKTPPTIQRRVDDVLSEIALL